MDLTNRTSVFSYSGNNLTAELNMNGNKIRGVAEPDDATDVATKTYVDNSTAGSITSSDDLNFNSLSLNGTSGLGTNKLNVNGNTRLGGNLTLTGHAINGIEVRGGNLADLSLRTTQGYGNVNDARMRIRFSANLYEASRIETTTNTTGPTGVYRGNLLFYNNFNNSLIERMRLTAEGRLGIGLPNPTQLLHVQGNILASGTISGASKNFIIDHPNPSKKNTHNLIHTAIETNTRGTCFYEFNAYVEESYILSLPSYFKYLICDDSVKCHITPIDELCMVCYKKIDNQNIQIRTSAPCNVSILVSGVRKDEKAIELWKGDEVEKVKAEEEGDN